MIQPHVFMVHFRQGFGNVKEDRPFYSYVTENSEVSRLMGVEMPPVRGVGLAQWLEQHQNLPPPTHSPTMLVNTNAKTNTSWRNETNTSWRNG